MSPHIIALQTFLSGAITHFPQVAKGVLGLCSHVPHSSQHQGGPITSKNKPGGKALSKMVTPVALLSWNQHQGSFLCLATERMGKFKLQQQQQQQGAKWQLLHSEISQQALAGGLSLSIVRNPDLRMIPGAGMGDSVITAFNGADSCDAPESIPIHSAISRLKDCFIGATPLQKQLEYLRMQTSLVLTPPGRIP